MTEQYLLRLRESGVAYTTWKSPYRKQTALICSDTQGERIVAYFKTACEANLFREWLHSIAVSLPAEGDDDD